MKKQTPFLLTLFFTLGMVILRGQNTEFTASANKTTVGKNETFRVTYTLKGDGKDFTSPDFEHFRVVGGPMKGSNYSSINGRVSQSVTWTYDLKPQKVGTFNISKASVSSEGKKIYSNPLTIKVVKSSVKPKNPNSPEAKASAGTILEVSVNRKSAYVGQPIYVTYKIYSRFRYNIGIPEEPDFEGFIATDNTPDKSKAKIEVREGKEYYSDVLKQFVLFPQKPGKFSFDPLVAEMISEVRHQDSWGFQTFRNVRHYPEGRFPALEIKPLPPGAPEGFNGAVGQYTFSLNMSRKEANADESVTIAMNLEGEGNLRFVKLPELELPSSLETYDPKSSESLSLGRSGFRGSKKQEYLVIPRYKGTFRIPSVTFSYFDPRAESYRTIKSEDYNLQVLSGNEVPGEKGIQTRRPKGQQEIEILDEDIVFIKTESGEFQKDKQPFTGSTLFWILLGVGLSGISLPWILFPITTKVVRKNKILTEGKLFRRFQSRIKKGREKASAGDMNAAYEILEQALEEFLSSWLKIERSQLNLEEIKSGLQAQGFGELTGEVEHLFQECNMARYSPVSASTAEGDMDAALEWVRKIQKRA